MFRCVSATSAHAHTRVYLLLSIPCKYVYVSMLYNIQSQTYVISNVYIYTLKYAPKTSLSCNATNTTFIAHTPWVVGKYVYAYL